MSDIKIREHLKNSSGSYDAVFRETLAEIVLNNKGGSVQDHIDALMTAADGAHGFRWNAGDETFEVYDPVEDVWIPVSPVTAEEIEVIRADIEALGLNKADRVIDAVAGNLATLDESGAPADSGISLDELQEKMRSQSALHIFSELDDVQMCTGTFINAGAGWNTFVFPSEFRDVPVVTAQIMGQEAIIMVQNVTTSGFQYQIRQLTAVLSGNVTASTANYFMADAAPATSVHTHRTVVTGVTNTLQVNGYSSTTAAAFQIAYQAILNGGVF